VNEEKEITAWLLKRYI